MTKKRKIYLDTKEYYKKYLSDDLANIWLKVLVYGQDHRTQFASQGRTSYDYKPIVDENKVIQFGNSTAEGLPSKIKEKLDKLVLQMKNKNEKLDSKEFKDWIVAENLLRQEEIIKLLGFDDIVSIMEAPSGTEADYIVNCIAEHKAKENGKDRVINYMPMSNQIGSGGKKVATDSHNSEVDCHKVCFGISLNKNQDCKLQSEIEMVLKEYNAFIGRDMISPEILEKMLVNQVEKDLKKGEIVRMNLVSGTKLGTSIGSPEFVDTLIDLKVNYDDRLILVLDNCQRIYFDQKRIQKWIDNDVIVLNTLSKADQAPPFYGFLLLGGENIEILNNLDWNPNLNFYFSKYYCGNGLEKLSKKIDNQAIDIGLFIRREVGLLTLRSFTKVNMKDFYHQVNILSKIVQNNIEGSKYVELTLAKYHSNKYVEEYLVKNEYNYSPDQWCDYATRFPLEIRLNGCKDFVNKESANSFRKFLNRDLSLVLDYKGLSSDNNLKSILETEFLLGQAVGIKDQGFIRVAIGNRQIIDACLNQDGELNKSINALFTKIDFIAENWDLINEVYEF